MFEMRSFVSSSFEKYEKKNLAFRLMKSGKCENVFFGIHLLLMAGLPCSRKFKKSQQFQKGPILKNKKSAKVFFFNEKN